MFINGIKLLKLVVTDEIRDHFCSPDCSLSIGYCIAQVGTTVTSRLHSCYCTCVSEIINVNFSFILHTENTKAAFTLRTTSYDHVREGETQKSRHARFLRTFVRTTSYVPAHTQPRTQLVDVKCVVPPAPEHSQTALLTT